MKKALTTLALVNFPMMIGLAVIAYPLVVLLLTAKWVESVPYLQLLCVVGLLFPVHLINLNVLAALGRSDLFLRLEIIKKGLILVNIAVTWRWGISAMICGMIVVSMFSYYLNSYYTGVLIDYPIWERAGDMLSYLIIAILMGVAVYATGLVAFPNLWSKLLVQIAIGPLIYFSLCRLFRLTAFMEMWEEGWSRVTFLRAGTTG
jgi:O-antigen/teichoic acid export membrane protein